MSFFSKWNPLFVVGAHIMCHHSFPLGSKFVLTLNFTYNSIVLPVLENQPTNYILALPI